MAEGQKAIWACAMAIVVVFLPVFGSFFMPIDLRRVLLVNSCSELSSLTVFIGIILIVLVSYVLMKMYVVPSIFGAEKWAEYDHLKRRKMVGTVMKVLVRTMSSVLIFCFPAFYFSFTDGLFADFNVRAAHQLHVEDLVVSTCEGAGMEQEDAVAMRAWIYGRCSLMAVMLWELAFIPELGVDIWLHHCFVILGVACGSDPMIQGATPEMQPVIDGIAFFLVLGAIGMGPSEVCAMMYHLAAPRARIQARWMGISAVFQGVTTILCFAIFPAVLSIKHRHVFGLNVIVAFAVLGFLTAVEIKLLFTKWAIVKHACKKERRAAKDCEQVLSEEKTPPNEQTPLEEQCPSEDVSAPSDHSVDSETQADSSEGLSPDVELGRSLDYLTKIKMPMTSSLSDASTVEVLPSNPKLLAEKQTMGCTIQQAAYQQKGRKGPCMHNQILS